MRRLLSTLGILTICLLGSVSVRAAKDEPCDCFHVGKVTKIVDGDTFDMQVRDGAERRIRPAGFDTPESGSPCYSETTRALRDLIYGKVVEARCYKYQPETKTHKRRDVCRVALDGQDIGLQMIQAGMAWHAESWAHEQRKDERRQYAEAEYKARQEQQGCLWAENYPSRNEPRGLLQ